MILWQVKGKGPTTSLTAHWAGVHLLLRCLEPPCWWRSTMSRMHC